MLAYNNSTLAASALYLALQMTKNNDSWDENMVKYTKLKESDLKSCASEMFMLLHNAQYSSLKAVKEKFADKKYGEVSTIKISSSSS